MAVREVLLISDPSVGFAIILDGQEYVFVGKKPYVKKDGTEVEFRLWTTRCKTCDEPFEAMADERMTYMSRRCVGCRPKK